MTLRVLVLILAACAAGCGESSPAPTPPAGPKASAVPPEVELDPAAAAERYKAASTKHRK
ncbi:MAG TPA: hypothetical protein VM529_25365 [Gemmata sp.]|nr:hypothetical protein [Gemmata sp.]